MLGEALSFPHSGDDGLKKILIGGILVLLGILIVPAIFVQGYLVRVLRAGAEGADESPTFDDWGDMLVDGIKLIVIGFVYLLVPTAILLAALFVVSIGVVFAAEGSGVGAGIGVVGGLLFLVALLLYLFVAYLLPAAQANFAYHDELGAAFDFRTVLNAAFSADYFVALVLAFVVVLVLGFLGALLSLLLVGFFLLFYVRVATFYLLGRGYAKGLGLEPRGESETTVVAD